MSAFVVDNRHIDLLVAAILRSEVVFESDADHVGTVLLAENYASVNYRYSEDEKPDSYHYTPFPLEFAGRPDGYLVLLKAVVGYQYQACEHPGWESSDAFRWTEALREMWVSRARLDHPGTFNYADQRDVRYPPAYESAPWSINADTEVSTR